MICWYKENLEHLNMWFRIFFGKHFLLYLELYDLTFISEPHIFWMLFPNPFLAGKYFFLHRYYFYVLNFPFQVIHIRICEILSNLINLNVQATNKNKKVILDRKTVFNNGFKMFDIKLQIRFIIGMVISINTYLILIILRLLPHKWILTFKKY